MQISTEWKPNCVLTVPAAAVYSPPLCVDVNEVL